MTRRGFLKGLLGVVLAGLFTAFYAFLLEPSLRFRVKRWKPDVPGWPSGRRLTIAVVADLHMGGPWMTLRRLRMIITRTNAIGADVIVVLVDRAAGHRFVQRPVKVADTGRVLGGLVAPLGVFGVLCNHDWWDDLDARRRGHGPVLAGLAMETNGIRVLENQTLRLGEGDEAFWLAGLGDQLALPRSGGRYDGVDDLPGTLAQIPDDGAPAILLAHEPDIFPKVPDRVALTLSGHTHGGQFNLFGWRPVVPSRFGPRFAYGPVTEGQRCIVTSGWLGCSIIPVRFDVVPEVTVVELGA